MALLILWFRPIQVGFLRLLLIVCLSNVLTHTVFWNIFPLTPGIYLLKLWVWEGGVTLLEALSYRGMGGMELKTALGAALILNLFSMFAGALLLY